MKKLFAIWGELNSELSGSQKFALRFVAGTGAFIFVGFLVLAMLMVHKGKTVLQTEGIPVIRESFVFPKGAMIETVLADGKENYVFKVNINKKEYLYIYTSGQKEPQRIVDIDYR